MLLLYVAEQNRSKIIFNTQVVDRCQLVTSISRWVFIERTM